MEISQTFVAFSEYMNFNRPNIKVKECPIYVLSADNSDSEIIFSSNVKIKNLVPGRVQFLMTRRQMWKHGLRLSISKYFTYIWILDCPLTVCFLLRNCCVDFLDWISRENAELTSIFFKCFFWTFLFKLLLLLLLFFCFEFFDFFAMVPFVFEWENHLREVGQNSRPDMDEGVNPGFTVHILGQ